MTDTLTGVHQGADAALLCELCMDKGLQADSTSSAAAQSSAPVSQRQQCAILDQGASLSPLDKDSAVIQQPDGRRLSGESCHEALRCEPRMRTHHSTAHGRASHPGADHAEEASQEQHGAGQIRRLRILCLHGFRQSASSLKGRTAALARKLADLAELIYIDAPHPLPFLVKRPSLGEASDCGQHPERGLQEGDAMPEEQGCLKASVRPQECKPRGENKSEADGSSSRWGADACKSSPSTAVHQCSAAATQHYANGHTEDVLTEPGVVALPNCQLQPQQRRYRRAWLLEPEQVPVSQVSLMQT